MIGRSFARRLRPALRRTDGVVVKPGDDEVFVKAVDLGALAPARAGDQIIEIGGGQVRDVSEPV